MINGACGLVIDTSLLTRCNLPWMVRGSSQGKSFTKYISDARRIHQGLLYEPIGSTRPGQFLEQ